MSDKVYFDTLKLAKMLEKGGVEHSDVLTSSISKALTQNIYTKQEVENMLETALKSFDERTQQLRIEAQQQRNDNEIFL